MVFCEVFDARATEFSLIDAIARACDGEPDVAWAVEESLRPFVPGESAANWADEPGRTRAEVLSLLDKAYARAAAIERTTYA